MTMPVHPIIAMFQTHAEVLDAQGTVTTVDDAIWKLAAWTLGSFLMPLSTAKTMRISSVRRKHSL